MAVPRNSVPSASARIAGTGAADTFVPIAAADVRSGKGLECLPRFEGLRLYRSGGADSILELIRSAEPSIDREQMPGHEVGGRRGEEYRGAREGLRLAPAARRRAPLDPGPDPAARY